MRNLSFIFIVLCLITHVASAQKQPRRTAAKPVVKQGICGTVVEKRGNRMPGPGAAASAGRSAVRNVLIFKLLNASEVDMGENGFINSVRNAKPVKTVQSDAKGRFCVSLPAGKYTVMVREPKGLYANLSDGENNIFPVEVTKNRQATITVEITHAAVF